MCASKLVLIIPAVFALLIQQNSDKLPRGQEFDSAQAKSQERFDQAGDPLPQYALARIGTTRLQHPREIMTVLFSPDGKSLFTSGYSDGVQRRRTDRISDRDALNGAVRVWNPHTGQLLRKYGGFAFGADEMALSSSGKLLGVISNNLVCMLELDTGKIRYQNPIMGTGVVRDMSFSADDKTIAVTAADARVQLWDTATGKLIKRFGPGFESAVSYSPDGKYLASSGEYAVFLWDPIAGREVWQFKIPDRRPCNQIKFTRDGRFLAACNGNVWLLDARTGKQVREWNLHDVYAESVALSPDSAILAMGSMSGEIRLWEVETGKQICQLSGHRSYTYSLAFSPDGKLLASGGHDGYVRLSGRQLS